RIEEIRTATDEDRIRVSAQAAFVEANKLDSEGSRDTRIKAIDRYLEALSNYKATNNRFGQAHTLNNIGYIYCLLGENQKAIDYYNLALSLRKQIGNRFIEAATLNNIGQIYSSLGESQKALDYYNLALPLRRQIGDRSGEATTL